MRMPRTDGRAMRSICEIQYSTSESTFRHACFCCKNHDFRNIVYHLWPANRLNQHPSFIKTITILPMKLGLQINLRRIFVYEFLPLGSVPCATIEVCLTEAPYGFLKKKRGNAYQPISSRTTKRFEGIPNTQFS